MSRKSTIPERNCAQCGKQFKPKRNRGSGNKGSYCSSKCWTDSNVIPIEIRLWRKVPKRSSDECWEFGGHCNSFGYGVISFRDKLWLTHRVSWVLANGEIPDGLYVLHKCDNPPCVNPNHLFLGTYKDNAQDKIKKNRANTARGEAAGMSKLTESDVRKIRSLREADRGLTYETLATMFGVTHGLIGHIVNRRIWKHI